MKYVGVSTCKVFLLADVMILILPATPVASQSWRFALVWFFSKNQRVERGERRCLQIGGPLRTGGAAPSWPALARSPGFQALGHPPIPAFLWSLQHLLCETSL
jgi:hypothetical protein